MDNKKEVITRMDKRVLAEFENGREGPLLVVIGAMHGNEPAGVEAIIRVNKRLVNEEQSNTNFKYNGKFVGLIGNMSAYAVKRRFMQHDLNRSWIKHTVSSAFDTDVPTDEAKEIKELIIEVKDQIKKSQCKKVIFLDLHTTSSSGGIFSIVSDDVSSLEIAKEIHAPVILNMLQGLEGTLLHYFNDENFNIDASAVTFESGQHRDPLSVDRAVAAIINCMRTINAVEADVVENIHDDTLKRYSEGLPKVSRLIYKHSIPKQAKFIMNPGYKNFQSVVAGEHLANEDDRPVLSKTDGMILMPLYQDEGEDGFFIIEEVNAN